MIFYGMQSDFLFLSRCCEDAAKSFVETHKVKYGDKESETSLLYCISREKVDDLRVSQNIGISYFLKRLIALSLKTPCVMFFCLNLAASKTVSHGIII